MTTETWIANVGPCEGYGFSDSGSTNAAGVNVLENSVLGSNILSSGYVTNTNSCGVRLSAQQYSPDPDFAIEFDNDFIYGDTCDVWLIGTPARNFNNDIFGKGANPVSSGYLFVNVFNGDNQGSTAYGELTFLNPTFQNGVTESMNNYATAATNNTGLAEDYRIKFGYTVTVEKASNSAPITGATVSIIDAQSGTECTLTTNSSGVATCNLNENVYGMTGGSAYTTHYNPMAITITASGCTTGVYSESITSLTSETKKLSGC
jgi:hypothetical protein